MRGKAEIPIMRGFESGYVVKPKTAQPDSAPKDVFVEDKGWESFNEKCASGIIVKDYGLTKHNVSEAYDAMQESVDSEPTEKGAKLGNLVRRLKDVQGSREKYKMIKHAQRKKNKMEALDLEHARRHSDEMRDFQKESRLMDTEGYRKGTNWYPEDDYSKIPDRYKELDDSMIVTKGNEVDKCSGTKKIVNKETEDDKEEEKKDESFSEEGPEEEKSLAGKVSRASEKAGEWIADHPKAGVPALLGAIAGAGAAGGAGTAAIVSEKGKRAKAAKRGALYGAIGSPLGTLGSVGGGLIAAHRVSKEKTKR